MEKFHVDCYNVLMVEIDIIRFFVNLVGDYLFSIILHVFLLHIVLERK